jgi:hypothetical protein
MVEELAGLVVNLDGVTAAAGLAPIVGMVHGHTLHSVFYSESALPTQIHYKYFMCIECLVSDKEEEEDPQVARDREKKAIEAIAAYLCGPGKTCPHHLKEGAKIYDMAHAK